MKTKILLFNFLLFFVINSFAQNLVVPSEYRFETEKDCENAEAKVIECITWINSHKLDDNIDIRHSATEYVNAWFLNSNSKIYKGSTKISEYILSDKNNPFSDEFYNSYIFGLVLIQLENTSELTNLQINSAGVNNLIDVYNNNSHLNIKSKIATNFIELKSKNEINAWIEKNL